ncbi:MAG: hypothetical protein K5905_07610 [Roseibium sp.]|uniref:hypothetical protein n=1 Tax=Roseibium sp. TaxID=1936156 RepID=UPI00260D4037|nr:hypothetical protein [Roseibium sp.]MCV0425323.1 hypothetical protein [Roseibium sp.]
MMHTKDIYEQRARALRHRELRALARAVSGLVLSAFSGRQTNRKDPFSTLDPVNDQSEKRNRAA